MNRRKIMRLVVFLQKEKYISVIWLIEHEQKRQREQRKKSLNLYSGLTMQAATFLMFGARLRWQSKSRRSYNPRQKSLKQTPLLLNFLENSWDLLLNKFVLTVMCPLPPQCWATRILKHWDCCNAQINIGEGKTYTSVSRFLTRIVGFHSRLAFSLSHKDSTFAFISRAA